MSKIAAVFAIAVLSGMAITGVITSRTDTINASSIQERQLQQQVAIEAYGLESTHQFAASCMSESGIWYDVYYEAQEPDLALEVELCDKNLVP